MSRYVLGIDQSTQGTKALLFDEEGTLICRTDLPHKQYINEKGWVEHDPEEIYANTLAVVKNLVEKAGINKNDLAVLGISNQRETAMVWNRTTGKPVYNAVVWQCARGAQICEEIEKAGDADMIRSHTGLQLSPYFSAAKIAWVLKNVGGVQELADKASSAAEPSTAGLYTNSQAEKSSAQITPTHPEPRCSTFQNLNGTNRYVAFSEFRCPLFRK